MNAVDRVIHAWTDPGERPIYHRAWQSRLRRDWPVLARALDGLVKAEQSSVADDMAGALALALHDAHPSYGNTTGWRGGIGGQAITPGCHFNDPPPGEEWAQYDLLSTPLRAYLAEHPDFDLDAAKARVREQALRALGREG